MKTKEVTAALRLGVEGFSYPDLFNAARLKDLMAVFDSDLAAANPELFRAWHAYRSNPGVARTPVEISALLVGVSGHVSRFLARLFDIEAETAALAAATSDQNPVFRFKIDFVRRRVLPMLKKIVSPTDPAGLEKSIQHLRDFACGESSRQADLELATALA